MAGLTPLARLRARRFNPDQPRDAHGEWTAGEGGSEEDAAHSVYERESAAGASLGRGQTFGSTDEAESYANKVLSDSGSKLGPAEVQFTDTPNESGSFMSHDGATHPVVQLGLRDARSAHSDARDLALSDSGVDSELR